MQILTAIAYSPGNPINAHTHLPCPYPAVYQHPDVVEGQLFSAGIHPLTEYEAALHLVEQLPVLLENPACIAVGECGLDKLSPMAVDQQLDIFNRQAKLAARYALPVIIHCVGRWNELERLFKAKKAGSPAWIIHGFRKIHLAEKFLQLGAYLSIGNALTYDERLQTLVKTLPLEQLFLETDDADADLLAIYQTLATLKSLSLPAVVDQLYSNYIRVFHHDKLA